ncbi:coiled-coil domain-containing protein 9 [Phaethornis superciliosus]
MSAALALPSRDQKAAELDLRIEALRRKNRALLRRYQEIEEDRRKAEQEGVAVTAPRPPRRDRGDRGDRGTPPGIDPPQEKPPGKKSLSTPKPRRGSGPPHRLSRGDHPQNSLWDGTPGGGGTRGGRSRGRGGPGMGQGGDPGADRKSKEWEERRRQNIEKMNEEMEKIAEYERNQRDGLHEKNPVRNFLDDPRRSGPFQDSDRRDGSRRHVRNWGGTDFDKVKAGMEREKTSQGPGRHPSPKSGVQVDMTLSMTGRERAEYVRWKKEREEIDRQRLERHRKPGGQWRREWDAEKPESMFKEGSVVDVEPRCFLPKPPTFGEFLPQTRAQRRRKSRGGGPKPYSMHDDRWDAAEPPAPVENVGNQEVEEAPLDPPTSSGPEEDEDQWEDVSEEEEEDEDEDGSQGDPPHRLTPGEVTEPSGGPQNRGPPPEIEPQGVKKEEVVEPSEKEETSENQSQDVSKQPEVEMPPGRVEITDFQRTTQDPRCPPEVAPPSPTSPSHPGTFSDSEE